METVYIFIARELFPRHYGHLMDKLDWADEHAVAGKLEVSAFRRVCS